eukprot:scaffold31667_cov107-Isochrysis_galbana.AAC.7
MVSPRTALLRAKKTTSVQPRLPFRPHQPPFPPEGRPFTPLSCPLCPQAIIAAFRTDPTFAAFAKNEMEMIVARDDEDGEKLAVSRESIKSTWGTRGGSSEVGGRCAENRSWRRGEERKQAGGEPRINQDTAGGKAEEREQCAMNRLQHLVGRGGRKMAASLK